MHLLKNTTNSKNDKSTQKARLPFLERPVSRNNQKHAYIATILGGDSASQFVAHGKTPVVTPGCSLQESGWTKAIDRVCYKRRAIEMIILLLFS